MRSLLLVLLPVLSTAQVITTIAGNGTETFGGDGGAATAAWINRPEGVAVDSAGNVTFADTGNIRVRKVNSLGVISTFAGDGTIKLVLTGTSLGDGGQATSAGFAPARLCFRELPLTPRATLISPMAATAASVE